MKKFFIAGLRAFHASALWRRTFLFSVFGFSSECRSTPTCSEYTISQIEKHGTITGLKLGLQRVRLCHA